MLILRETLTPPCPPQGGNFRSSFERARVKELMQDAQSQKPEANVRAGNGKADKGCECEQGEGVQALQPQARGVASVKFDGLAQILFCALVMIAV